MLRKSTKLNRWSIARAIRSGRPLNWQARQPPFSSIPSSAANVDESPPSISDDFENNGKMPEGKAIHMVPDGTGCTAEHSVSAALGQFEHCLHSRRSPVHSHPLSSIPSSAYVDESPPSISDDFEYNGKMPEGKTIYMVSDGTGWTAEHSVSAALGQFEHCLHNRRCPVHTHLFSGVRDMDRLMEIIKQAGKEGALLLYTLADPLLAKSVEQACKLWGVPSTDILRPTTEAIASHFGVAPLGIPRGAPGRKSPITEEFLRRNEAIAFTIRQDDGARPEQLSRAHIVLVGVSRTGKTPLAIYLAQKGYKVANVPIVMGAELPETLFEIDQEKVFGLTINPVVLQSIRNARIKNLKLESQMSSNYSEMDHVRKELEYANRIFMQNPLWPVIDITGRVIEETAAIVVRMNHDRKQKNAFPRISKQY